MKLDTLCEDAIRDTVTLLLQTVLPDAKPGSIESIAEAYLQTVISTIRIRELSK